LGGRFVGVTTSHGAAASRFSAWLGLYTAIGLTRAAPPTLLALPLDPVNKLLPAPMLGQARLNKSTEVQSPVSVEMCVFITAVLSTQVVEGTAKFNGKFVQFGNKRQKNANN
jgi:hypothetical protein